MRYLFYICLSIIMLGAFPLKAQEFFHFEDIKSLSEMESFLQEKFSLEDDRSKLQDIFIKQGHATLFIHPNNSNFEKYIYDINLCKLYIWRWNISANYSEQGKLEQIYMNGLPVFEDGTPLRTIDGVKDSLPENPRRQANIFKVQRPRPEATKGETSLGFVLYDLDSDQNTINDQFLIGAGPSRPDPHDFGELFVYKNIDPWRSIFDFDETERIVPYSGECPKEK